MKKIAFYSLILASVAFMMISCGDDKKKETPAETPETEEVTTPSTDAEETPAEEESNVIVIVGNDQMKYDKTEITVKAGEEVTILLKSEGNLAPEVMSHDLVVLTQGTAARDFGMEAAKAGGIDKISDELKENVIAATKMLSAGQEDKITFTLDEAGKYEFVCTFPGHFASMNGVIIAE